MYSGSDSTESANYGQWPLNPTFFQNMPNEQVDWAALAQQWIQMKEAGPPIPEPKSVDLRKENNTRNEKTLLPLLKNDDGAADSSWGSLSNAGESYDNSWNWKTQPNWEWNNTWNQHLNTQLVSPTSKSTLLPTPKGYSTVESSIDSANVNTGYTTRPNDYGSGFSGHPTNNSRHYKPHNRRYSKVNITKPIAPAPPVNISQMSDLEATSLDASKRKQLPAWIREGLEKMERDKQKQIEKEKEKEKQSLYTEKIKEQEKETMEILKDTIKERRRSKFDSDEDQSPKRTEKHVPEATPMSHDELMLVVRKTMTEILLKVTTEAIHSVCTEERQRYVKKFQSSHKNYGKTSLTSKLGLGMYGSDSGSESDDSVASRKDSDDELKNTIKKRKADFVHTEKGIESKLFQAEQKKGNHNTNDEDENSSDNQIDERNSVSRKDDDSIPKNYSNSKKHRDSSFSSEESDMGSSQKKSSSRSRESSSSNKKRNKSRSRDRGYTPEKRKRRKSPKRSRSRSYDRKRSSDYKYKKEKNHSDSHRSRRSRSRSRISKRSRSRSSSYRSKRSEPSKSKRKSSRSPYYSRDSRRSRSRSHNKSSRNR